MWVKSSYSNPSGNCVQVDWSEGGEVVSVRDSKDFSGLIMHFARGAWNDGRAMLFTPVNTGRVPRYLITARDRAYAESGTRIPDHDEWFRATQNLKTLFFCKAEVDAFRNGVENGEFARPSHIPAIV